MKRTHSFITTGIMMLFLLGAGGWLFSQESSVSREVQLQEVTLDITGMT